MVRRARVGESPKFGSVWGWGDADPPLMAISPVDEPGELDYRWRFLPLLGPSEISVWYWLDFNGVVYDDWLRLDDD